jgi:SAM-dependent methyltransferase
MRPKQPKPSKAISMTSDLQTAFFEIHRDLPREGPGEAADVAWATALAEIGPCAHIADVGCGPGADIGALLQAAPQGQVTALDKTAHFIEEARGIWQDDGRVTLLKADMGVIRNQYDMIWCAGAIYFLGITQALTAWRKSLTKGGVVAFTEMCWYTDTPSDRARALWKTDYSAMTNEAGIRARIDAAGYEVVGTRQISDQAWENYFTPIDARIAALRPKADDTLTAVLDAAVEEAACWRAHRDEYGYLLCVVRPK